MEPGANLAEWMELLNEMLQFLDATVVATTTAEMCSCSKNSKKKAIDGNRHRHHHHHQQQCDEEKCEVDDDDDSKTVPPPGTDGGPTNEEQTAGAGADAEYMNIVNKIDESRYTLAHKCRALLRKLQDLSSSSSVVPQNVLEQDREDGEEEEEENSYLEMGGVGHKNDINLTQPPADKIESGENFESTCVVGDIVGGAAFCDDTRNEAELNLEENCYDFTTDRCLYDECLEAKLNNQSVNVVVAPMEESATSKCPFSGLPAAHLRIKHSPKSGTLFRQEKRLFFDQTKKYYVGLLDRWLLLYNNSNELKPTQCIQVKDIKLDLSLNDQINEKSQFHIITQEDSKICFTSPSFKELNEWVVAIQQNLLAKPEQNSPRKLPLPPTPTPYTTDETDTPGSAASISVESRIDSEESIYEEPQLLSKHRPPESCNNYDTPKHPSTSTDNLSQHHLKASPTKIINDAPISPRKPPPCETITPSPLSPPVASNPTTTTTPVKSWIFNRFNKSPSSSNSNSSDSEPPTPHITTAKKPPKKQLSFQQQDPKVTTTTPTSPIIPTTTVSSVSKSNKGSKINMIISQLEANGQLSLLSKSLSDKRNTWCLEE